MENFKFEISDFKFQMKSFQKWRLSMSVTRQGLKPLIFGAERHG